MTVSVPLFVWPIVLGADSALVALLVASTRRHGGPRARGRAVGVGLTLAAWFALAILLSAGGVFEAGAGRAPTIGLGVFPPILIGGLALAFSRTAREAALAVPQLWLIGIQSLRALGLVFVVLFARGVLPGQFALPAGWGDFAIGATAPAVAWAVSRGKSWAPPLARVWNVLGLLDLALAVSIGALSAESSIRLFSNAPSTAAMAELPLSMIPVFAVPIFVLLHMTSLLGLRASHPRGTQRVEPPELGVGSLRRPI